MIKRTPTCKIKRNEPTTAFTLIELMIAIALVGIFLPAIGSVVSISVFSAKQGEDFAKATALAREQMEAVYSIRKDENAWDWDSTPENTLGDEYYQPILAEGNWSLGNKTTDPLEIDGFTKTVQINSVCRNLTGLEIVDCETESGYFVDDITRKISVNVRWSERGQEQNVTLYSYLVSN
jgi:prepilin-type N-terminal cleavage/methylation domain-containing protein